MEKREATQRLAIIGDLHYETSESAVFDRARRQLVGCKPDQVFSLGDMGGYTHCGTRLSFNEGRQFFSGFDLPFQAIVGNHDMESPEFETDQQMLREWCEVFKCARPYATVDLGSTLAICLAQTEFRTNRGALHEVHLDDEQVAWFEAMLAAHKDRPVFVFSHAPILGAGLRILLDVHLMTPNAYLNHADRPERFMRIVRANPQIKVWVSGHSHLGQNYADSLSQVGACLFVHTGVIGGYTRDGSRHSRIVDFDERHCVVLSLDHASGELASDLEFDYVSGVCRRLRPLAAANTGTHFSPPPFPTDPQRVQVGHSAFVLYRGMLVEYDTELAAPLGVVDIDLNKNRIEVRDGVLRAIDPAGKERIFKPRADGRFMKIFGPNPWLRGGFNG